MGNAPSYLRMAFLDKRKAREHREKQSGPHDDTVNERRLNEQGEMCKNVSRSLIRKRPLMS